MTNARVTTLKLVDRYYDAFNQGNTEEMLALLSDDVAHDVNQGERREGKALFKEFCAHMTACYKERLEDLVVMASDDGRYASAVFTVVGEYLATDNGLPPANHQTYRIPAGGFLEVEEGKITRVATHYNLNDWIAQIEKNDSNKG